MMVHKEHGLAILLAPQAHPHGRTPPIILVMAVFAHINRTMAKAGPLGLPPGHCNGTTPVEHLVLGMVQVRIVEDAPDVVALLKAHDVIFLSTSRPGNEPSSTPVATMMSIEQVPPEEVVCQDFDDSCARGRAALEVPRRRRDVHFTPRQLCQ